MHAEAAGRSTGQTNTSRSVWDNDLPPGDAPPLPRWPLTLAVSVYVVWMAFLISMMILRLTQVP
jgi:hypothetical protein